MTKTIRLTANLHYL